MKFKLRQEFQNENSRLLILDIFIKIENLRRILIMMCIGCKNRNIDL